MVDTRRRVTVFESGVTVRLETWDGGLTSPIDARGPLGGSVLRALERRDDSLVFFAFFVASRPSLLMTSTNALLTDARLRDCLMELLVVGLDFGGVGAAAAACETASMGNVK